MTRQFLHVAMLGAAVAHAHSPCAIDDPAPFASPADTEFTWTTQDAQANAPRPSYAIGLWGDSLSAAPHFMDAALAASGMPPTAVLPSFIQAGINVSGLSLPLRAACAAGWRVTYAHKQPSGASLSKGMLSMFAEPGAALFLDFRFPFATTRVQSLAILYAKPAPGDSLLLGISIDGGAEQLVSLRRSAGPTLRIQPDAPMATMRLRVVSGQVALHGFLPRYQDAPAVVADTMSVPGGLLRGWAHVDADLAPGPAYNLVLVQYGTNEGANPGFDAAQYAIYLRTNLAALRAVYPRARCILIGPPDRGVPGSFSLKFARVHQQIALAQQQAGRAAGCAFWDWQEAMGGPGAATRWAAMNPPLMQPDLTHLTARGYQVSGKLFAQAFPLKPY